MSSKRPSKSSRRPIAGMVWDLGRRFNEDLLTQLNEAGFTDLRPVHSAVFRYIDDAGTRITDIADKGQTTRQAVWQIVTYLEKQGYVKRFVDRTDARAKVVRLTRKGRRAVDVADAIIQKIERSWSREIGGRKMRELRSTLQHLVRALNDSSGNGNQ